MRKRPQITITLAPETFKRLEELAKYMATTRAYVIDNAVDYMHQAIVVSHMDKPKTNRKSAR